MRELLAKLHTTEAQRELERKRQETDFEERLVQIQVFFSDKLSGLIQVDKWQEIERGRDVEVEATAEGTLDKSFD